MADITASIRRLGNPAGSYNGSWTYARNVWDMQAFNSKLYIGCGNSINSGPDANAGPVPIIVYDPSSGTFTNEGVSGSTIGQGQTDRFRVLDFGSGDQICIPGHDPTGANAMEWYRYESGSWAYHTTGTPATVHAFDLLVFGGDFFAAEASGTGSVARSTNGGTSWTEGTGPSAAVYHLFEFGGKLYGSSVQSTNSILHPRGLWEWQSGTTWTGVSGSTYSYNDVFPGKSMTPDVTTNGKIVRTVLLGSTLVYIGADVYNTYQDNPFGLYSLTGLSTSGVTGATDRSFTNGGTAVTPYDLMVISGTLYVLGAHTSGGHTVVGVYSTTDLSSWTTEFTFTPNSVGSSSQGEAFARSFEKIGNTWYFGLGSLTSPIPSNTGDILAYTPGTLFVPFYPSTNSVYGPSVSGGAVANVVYPKYKEALISGSSNIALSSGTVKIALVDTGTYTYNAAHDFLDDVSGVVGTAITLGSKTVTNGLFDAADGTFSAVTGNSAEALIIYIDTGSAATSRLVAYIDTGVTGLPVTPNGGDIAVTFNASGIFQL